jgi:hypothetical protein
MRSPVVIPDLVIRGAAYVAEPQPAMVVIRFPPAQFHALCQGASGRWIPRFLIGDGQQVWGTLAQLPAITWRLDLAAGVALPEVVGRIPPAGLEQALESRLRSAGSPVSQIRITDLKIQGEPAESGEEHLRLHLAGTATIVMGDARLPLQISDLSLSATVRRALRPDGRTGLVGTVAVQRLAGTAPILGDLSAFRDLLEKNLNQRLGQELPKTLVQEWMPMESVIDISVLADVIF